MGHHDSRRLEETFARDIRPSKISGPSRSIFCSQKVLTLRHVPTTSGLDGYCIYNVHKFMRVSINRCFRPTISFTHEKSGGRYVDPGIE